MSLDRLENDLPNLADKVAIAFAQDLRAAVEDALRHQLNVIVDKAVRDLTARMAVRLAAHYDMLNAVPVVSVHVEGLTPPKATP